MPASIGPPLVSTSQPPPDRVAPTAAPRRSAPSPPCAANRGEAGSVEGGDLDVGAARPRTRRRSTARASPGISRSSSRAIEMDRRMFAGQVAHFLDRLAAGPVRCTAPRAAQQRRRRCPASPASNIGLDARLSRRSGVSPPRLACQKAAERPVAWRPHRSSASISITRSVAGEPRAEAGSGNPAADDQDVNLSPSRRLVTVWKAAPSRGGVMMNGGFTDLPARPAGRDAASGSRSIDVRTFTISNRLNLADRAARAALLVVGRPAAVARRRDPRRRSPWRCSCCSPAPSTSA